MTFGIASWVALTMVPLCSVFPAQLLPPPKDGDIRMVHWELRNESEVWLTLEPKSVEGRPAPMLTFTHTFPGKLPGPPAKEIEVRAYGWAPSAELRFELDGKDRIELSPPGGILTSGTPSDYVRATITVDVLRQLAQARQITGRALGVNFELSDSQRKAIASFADRVGPGGRPEEQ